MKLYGFLTVHFDPAKYTRITQPPPKQAYRVCAVALTTAKIILIILCRNMPSFIHSYRFARPLYPQKPSRRF